LRWLKRDPKNQIKLGKKKIWFNHSESKPHRALAATLDKTPYVDPDIEAERQDKIRKLDVQLRVDKVQVGLFYRPHPGANRNFSIEWEASYTDKSLGWLSWEYEHKLIRIQIGDRMTEQIGSSIVIKFSNIRKLGVNYDFGNPCK
jgi:RNA-dependent RNA polymerase